MGGTCIQSKPSDLEIKNVASLVGVAIIDSVMNETIVIDTPEGIKYFRQRALLGALKLEMIGLKRSIRPSAYAIIKKEYGLKGDKQKVCEQFERILEGLVHG